MEFALRTLFLSSTLLLSKLFGESFAQQSGAGQFGDFQNFNQFFSNAFGSPQQLYPGQQQQSLNNLYANYIPASPLQNPLYASWYAPYVSQQHLRRPSTPSAGTGRGATPKAPAPTLAGSTLITRIIDHYALPWPNAAPQFTISDLLFADPYWQQQLLNSNALPQLSGGGAVQQQQQQLTPQLLALLYVPTTNAVSAPPPADGGNGLAQPLKQSLGPTATLNETPSSTIADPLDSPTAAVTKSNQHVASPNRNEPTFVVKPITPTIIDPFTKPQPQRGRTPLTPTTTELSPVTNGESAAAVRPDASDEQSLTATPPPASSESIPNNGQTTGRPPPNTDELTTPHLKAPTAEAPLIGIGEDKASRKPPPKKNLPSTTTAATTTTSAPDTDTATDAPSHKPTDCKTNPTDSVCYHFSKQRANFVDAVEKCRQRHMVLAHANENNTDFLNKLVDDSLTSSSLKKTGKNCTERITIVANWTPFMRYGSYAFLYGNAQPECNFDEKQPFQSCAKDFDCTLVDWTRAAYFICASESATATPATRQRAAAAKLQGEAKKNVVQHSVQGELCTWSAHKTDYFEYLVSCEPIRPPAESSSDAASGSKVIELPQFPARCVPIDYGDFFGESNAAITAARKILKQDKISFWSSTIDLNVGQLKQCAPSCDDNEADQNSYVICRREIVKKTAMPRFFQEWHGKDGEETVPYLMSSEFNSTQKEIILGFVNKLANNSCLRFQEESEQAPPPSFLHILKDESPATCRGTVVGFVPGRAILSLGEQCFGLPVSILRLLLQSVGIPAEQNRYDRDQHITVNFDNINPEPIYKLNYEKQPLPGLLQLNTPYDFFTVAHFPPRVYAKSVGVNVFETKVKQVNGRKIDIDKNREMSEGDKAKLHILYGKSC